MKKIFFIISIGLIATAWPGLSRAACDCVCTFSGCPGGGPAPTLNQSVADQAACESLCRSAEPDLDCTGSTNVCRTSGTLPGGESGETIGGSGSSDLKFEPPLGTSSIQEIIGRIIQAVLGIVGSITLLMFVAGGFIWMTAAGNEKRVETGKNILIWSFLGLVVIFAAYAVTRFVLIALLQ